MLSDLTFQFRTLSSAVEKEEVQRAEIKKTLQYQDYEKRIEKLQAEQKKMLSGVCDSTEALEDVKEDLIKHFTAQGIKEQDGVRAVPRISKGVNCTKLLTVLGGDIDSFLVKCKVTQKLLKDYAKEELERYKKLNELPKGKKEYRQLVNCIEQVGSKIVDVEII